MILLLFGKIGFKLLRMLNGLLSLLVEMELKEVRKLVIVDWNLFCEKNEKKICIFLIFFF